MTIHDAPFVQPTRASRSRHLAASLVAGIALVAGPAFADPTEDAPAEEASAAEATEQATSDDTAAEDAALVMEGETPEAAVTRIEGEVATAEAEVTTARECAAAAARGGREGARTACPSAEAAQAALAQRRERLRRVRRHESAMKARHPRRLR